MVFVTFYQKLCSTDLDNLMDADLSSINSSEFKTKKEASVELEDIKEYLKEIKQALFIKKIKHVDCEGTGYFDVYENSEGKQYVIEVVEVEDPSNFLH